MRKHRSEDEWRNILGRWQESGLSGGAFARQEGLSESTFYVRAKRLGLTRGRAVDKEASKQRFARVRVVEAEPREGVVEVEARSGRVVRVRGRVDAEMLRVVLTVADEC